MSYIILQFDYCKDHHEHYTGTQEHETVAQEEHMTVEHITHHGVDNHTASAGESQVRG